MTLAMAGSFRCLPSLATDGRSICSDSAFATRNPAARSHPPKAALLKAHMTEGHSSEARIVTPRRRKNGLLPRAYHSLLSALPSSASLSVQYFVAHGSLPNLRSPRTFSEKIQYRKLFDRDPRLPILADKVLVKDYVAEKLGRSWLIPTIWSGKAFPPRAKRNWTPPFVVKTNHGSGRNIFVKAEPDWDSIELLCERWLRQTWQPHEFQWAYNAIEPQILIEPHMGHADARPVDYKFFVFGGRVEYIQVDTDRHTDLKRCFFDRNWRRQPFSKGRAVNLKYPLESCDIARPKHLGEMIDAAETLAADIPFVRVDLYDLERPLFGEMTFYPASGFSRFFPDSWDRTFGELWPYP